MTSSVVSVRVLRLLVWLRDNETHRAAWLPRYATEPQEFSHILIGGFGGVKRVSRATWESARPYVGLAQAEGRMFMPSAEGLRLLAEAGL